MSPTAPIATGSRRSPLHRPEESELRRSRKGDGTLGTSDFEGGRARRIRADLAGAAGRRGAPSKAEADAIGDAAFALRSPEAVVGMGVYTAKAMLHGKGKRRVGNASGKHPLIE